MRCTFHTGERKHLVCNNKCLEKAIKVQGTVLLQTEWLVCTFMEVAIESRCLFPLKLTPEIQCKDFLCLIRLTSLPS